MQIQERFVTAAKNDAAGGEPVAWENPLIPNKKLKALYVAMVELRLLDELVTKIRRPATAHIRTLRGEEGCRVTTTFDLKTGDLTIDGEAGVATGFLRGAKAAELVHIRPRESGEAISRGELPAVSRAVDRLFFAMGAAVALKFRKGNLLVAYVHSHEMGLAEWKPPLRFAAEQVLPVIFVVLPAAPGAKAVIKPGQLSLVSSKCGVPGIPVDTADPVALYRVVQESMLRARAGGGPVLMECVAFQLPGTKAAAGDPIRTMREFLLHRKIVDDQWLRGVETRFTRLLKAANRLA